ncbi:MAG: DUF6502 family protein [Candidatus Binatia bacterium]
MAELSDGLVRALAEASRPFVRRLLALGVPFGRVEAHLRALFVEIAEKEFRLPGGRQTDSRISLLTGINRKEVRRIRSAAGESEAPRAFAMNRATSLVGRWLGDPQATDREGRPLPIPYLGERGPSFVKLARDVTGDIAPRVLLDELIHSGVAELREGDVVALTGDSYVPKLASDEELEILAEDPAELVETMLRNILAAGGERWLQRKVYYDNLGADAAPAIRAEMRREGERFIRRINERLARYDRDRNPDAPGGARHYASLGVYFFEESRAKSATAAAPPAGGKPRVRLRRKKHETKTSGGAGHPSRDRRVRRRRLPRDGGDDGPGKRRSGPHRRRA